MHDSLTPLGGMLVLFNMLLGEIIYGGVGSGLYGMIQFILLTVFIAGLMVGRTPDYLGQAYRRPRDYVVHGGPAGLRHTDPVLLRRGGGEFVGNGRTE